MYPALAEPQTRPYRTLTEPRTILERTYGRDWRNLEKARLVSPYRKLIADDRLGYFVDRVFSTAPSPKIKYKTRTRERETETEKEEEEEWKREQEKEGLRHGVPRIGTVTAGLRCIRVRSLPVNAIFSNPRTLISPLTRGTPFSPRQDGHE